MGNAFSRKKAAKPAATSKAETGDMIQVLPSTNSSAASRPSSAGTNSSMDSHTTVEPIDRSPMAAPVYPSVPKEGAWSKDCNNIESAMKANTRMDNLMKLRALPPYGNVVTGKIDGGCSTTMLSQKTYDQLRSSGACEQLAPVTSTTSIYKFANGQTKKANSHIAISAHINNHPAEVHANVFDDPNTHFLLGLNFLRHHKVNIQYHPEGDRITCPALGLYDRMLPRDTAGLDILPFFADFPPQQGGKDERALEAGLRTSKRPELPGTVNSSSMEPVRTKRRW